MTCTSEQVDETASCPSHQLNQFVILIGDRARLLSVDLFKIGAIGTSENHGRLNLETKYYKNSVSVQCFSTYAQYNTWKTSTLNMKDVFIGAVFVVINNGSDQVFNEIYMKRLHTDDVLVESKAFVMRREEDMTPIERDRCMEWCNFNGFEMVYIENSEESVKDAVENRDKLGMARLEELLHVVDWPLKEIGLTRLTGHHRLDDVLNTLDSMSESDDDKAIPSEDDKEAIYEFLGMRSDGQNGSSIGSGRIAEASIDVNVTLKGGLTSSVSVKGDADGGKKKKGKGKNKGKNQGKTEEGDRASVEGAVTTRQSGQANPVFASTQPSNLQAVEENEDNVEKEADCLTDIGPLINTLQQTHELNKRYREAGGPMQFGDVMGAMEHVLKEMGREGEGSLKEELEKIEKERREGTYVENEDSD